jgi:HTH-type transcriptional repressor of NAD biosynthesis genes
MHDKGFVFGKFLPFHKGHEAMIRFARQYCNSLTVLVCCSNREDIPSDIRVGWIEETIVDDLAIEVIAFNYDENQLPNTSVTSENASLKWAVAFRQLLPSHGMVVTSEPYGNIVAAHMGIRHIPFDLSRSIVPISATSIRTDLFGNWQYLPQAVKPYYAKKVVLLGTESTGKSTLTALLAEHFGATAVAEVGRTLIPDSNDFSMADLYKVAEAHARYIEKATRGDKPLIVVDTDVHITQSYAQFFFNASLQLPREVYEANKAGLYIYLTKDAPYVQDGTRLDEDYRNKLDESHKQVLARAGVNYTEVSGSWTERLRVAISKINTWVSDGGQ